MTQVERVRRALKQRGKYGLTAVDFLAPTVIDGGTPITRLAARINELRNDGMRIEIAGTRDSCHIYRVSEAERSRGPVPVPLDPAPQLFPKPAVNAALNDWDAAA